MKLVEILARELRDWPGVRAISQGAQCFLRDEANYPMGMQLELASDWSTAIVTRAEWQAAVDALKADDCTHSYGSEYGCPECGANKPYSSLSDQEISRITRVAAWDGVGLPQVGTTCERRFPDVRGSSWNGCIILAHGARKIFVRDNCGNEWAHHIDEVEFRPFRTPEQIAADERESAINGMLTHDALGGSRRGLAAALYDAGYRKQEQK
jgi:hypothetical protein